MSNVGAYLESIDMINQSLQLNSFNHFAWYELAYLLRETKHYEESLITIEQCLAIKPDYEEGIELFQILIREIEGTSK